MITPESRQDKNENNAWEVVKKILIFTCTHDITPTLTRFNFSLLFWLILSVLCVLAAVVIYWPFLVSESETVRNMGLVAAAIIGFPMLIWRTRIADRQTQVAKTQAETALKQAETAEQSLVVDTYMKAIEQLGATDIEGKPLFEVRIGSLHTLERLARTSTDYHAQVMEVLCSYIRMRSPTSFPQLPEYLADVQTALNIVGRREKDLDSQMRLDLSESSFDNLSLSHADFSNAILTNSYFREIDLVNVNFQGAILSNCKFDGAKCLGVRFNNASIDKASFDNAQLMKTDFQECMAEDTSFVKASAIGSFFNGSNLVRTDFTNADLSCSSFEGAILDSTKFVSSVLDHTLFGDTDDSKAIYE